MAEFCMIQQIFLASFLRQQFCSSSSHSCVRGQTVAPTNALNFQYVVPSRNEDDPKATAVENRGQTSPCKN